MGMRSMATMFLCCFGALVCFIGMHREGAKLGYKKGHEDGYLTAMKEICEGHLKVEDRKFIFDNEAVRFYDKNGPLFELDMDQLDFTED